MVNTPWRTVINTLVLFIITMFSLVPFYIMFIMSTYISEDLFKGVVLFPGTYMIENLRTVMRSNYVRFYWNSFYIATLATFLAVLLSAMAGYALAKYNFKYKIFFFYFIVTTMMIPGQLGLVAFVVQMRYLGWTNTHLPLIIPAGANAFGVFWMTQFIKSAIPDEVIESARIDGCNELQKFFLIVIPFIKPAIATLSMLVFIASWNNYLLPLIILNRPDLFTIPLGIATLGNYYRTDFAARIMGLSLGTIPLFVIFFIGSNSFIRGLSSGAVKG